MSNFEKASNLASEWVGSMGGLDNISYLYGDDVSGLVQAIHDAGLLMPDVQIIRTLDEIEKLDAGTVTIDVEGTLNTVEDWLDEGGNTYPADKQFLPAVVLATGGQVRAARKALEDQGNG